MRNIAILLTLICLFLTCKPSDDDGMPNNLTTDNARELIPLSSYGTAARVIFVNQEGIEKSLNITIEEEQKEKTIGSFQYTADELVVSLNEEGNTDYSIHLIAAAIYLDMDSRIEFLNCLLFNNQTSNGTSIPSLRIESNRELILGSFETEEQLLDKTFDDVYSNLISSEEPAYSEIYYNVQFGVLGFKDSGGKLWVYERVE